MTLLIDGVNIDNLTFDGVSIDVLNMDGVEVWTRTSIPVATQNTATQSLSGANRLGSNTYNGGGTGNDGGNSPSSATTQFSNNFSGAPFTSFANSGSASGSSFITPSVSFNTSSGAASVSFSLSSSAGVGTFDKTYTFVVKATNAAGQSTTTSTWSVSCSFEVIQGQVPQMNPTYGTDLTSVNSDRSSLAGAGDSVDRSGSWAVRFTPGDAAVTSYTRTSWGETPDTYTSSFPVVNATGTTGNTTNRTVLSTSSTVGTYSHQYRENVYATNIYGNSSTLIWRVNTKFIVS